MKSRLTRLFLLFLVFGLLLSACGGDGTETLDEQADVPTVVDKLAVIVKGHLVPEESIHLSFASSGQIVEIFVEEGEIVKKGDMLARLGNGIQLDAQIASAEYELLTAQQARDDLFNGLAIARTNALQSLTVAKQEEHDAKRRFDNLPEGSTDFTKSQTEAEWEIARDRLEQAQAKYDILQGGPDPQDIAAVESRLAAAEIQLEALGTSLANLELRAPINGTVVDVVMIVGEQAIAGQPVLVMADFSSWYIETEDLNEIDVVEVSVGQLVTIIPDALPDLKMTGSVISISEMPVEKRGDITYVVRTSVVDVDPRLRWGMTVVVTFEE